MSTTNLSEELWKLRVDASEWSDRIERLAVEAERLEKEKQETLETWQAISASAHTRLAAAIDYIGKCQVTGGEYKLGCKCIYCEYWE